MALQVLSGWKDIANYLGKGVRTVQRYEVELGLPVRRPAGKWCGSVVATKAELDAWVSASPIRDSYHLTRMTADLVPCKFEEIKTGVLEMQKLRAQMAGLRAELKNSVQLLREGIQVLRGGLREDYLQEKAANKVTVLDSEFRTRNIFSLIGADMSQRKTN